MPQSKCCECRKTSWDICNCKCHPRFCYKTQPQKQADWIKRLYEKFPTQDVLEAVDLDGGRGGIVPVGEEFVENISPVAIEEFIAYELSSQKEKAIGILAGLKSCDNHKDCRFCEFIENLITSLKEQL